MMYRLQSGLRTILDISVCNMSDEGAESLARALTVNRSLQELNISFNKIGDNGIAHISTALQTNTTMTKLGIGHCSMLDEGAESLARALAINSSLQELNISGYKYGIASIATALQTNNTLKTLTIGRETTTDKEALSIAAAFTANSSLEYLKLIWISTHPDSTLKNIGEYVSKSTLRKLELKMIMPSDEAPVAEERAKEWLQCVEVGGKELIQSLEDSHLQTLVLAFDYTIRLKLCQHSDQLNQSHQALKATTAIVNMARRQKGLIDVNFWLLPNF